jgi:DNA-binding transcriptional MocR family regulator
MERNFKGVWIAAEIWLDKDLTLVEKALLAEIDSFTGNGRSFMKSNDTIQDEYGISRNTIGRSLRKLADRGFVEVTFNGRVRCVTTRAGSIPKMGRQSTQNGEAASPNDTSTNTSKRTTYNTLKEKGVVLPFDSKEFADAWDVWLTERRERGTKKYTQRGEQAALHKLQKDSQGDEATAIAIIHESIAHGWQGLFPLKNRKNDTKRLGPSDGSLIAEHLRRLANESGEGMA